LVLEKAEFQEKPNINKELQNKVIQELNKKGIYQSKPPRRDENKNTDDKPKKPGYSEINIHCQNIQQIKERVKEYYQKNKTEIAKNPDFNQ